MPERDDETRWKTLPQHPRDQCEVIILHEYERRTTGGFVSNSCSESSIRPSIHAEVAAPEYWLDVNGMAERPEPLVGKAVVVPAVLIVGEPHVTETKLRVGGRHHQCPASVDNIRVGVPGAVCHPCSGIGCNQWLEGRHESPARTFDDDPTIRSTLMPEWGTLCVSLRSTWVCFRTRKFPDLALRCSNWAKRYLQRCRGRMLMLSLLDDSRLSKLRAKPRAKCVSSARLERQFRRNCAKPQRTPGGAPKADTLA